MSTKSSIVCGKNFHLYHECFDEENIYLELSDCDFKCKAETIEDNRISKLTVCIPQVVWEVIRKHTGLAFLTDMYLANKSDDELRDFVRKQYEEHIQMFAKSLGDDSKKIMSHLNQIIFGPTGSSTEEELAAGYRYYDVERKRQQQIMNEIDEWEKETTAK